MESTSFVSKPTDYFTRLPIEIQVEIVLLLDPAALVALSQSSKHFRQLIDPKSKELIDRLLYLECTEEHGGGVPDFIHRGTTQVPPWSDPRVNQIRWACTECNHLLSHINFDNHYLMGVGYRKPVLGSPNAEPHQWQPTSSRKHKLKPRKDDANNPELRRIFHVLTTFSPDGVKSSSFRTLQALQMLHIPGLSDLAGQTPLPLDETTINTILRMADEILRETELQLRGEKRAYRRCNECRFQLRELGIQPDGSGGVPTVPIIQTRSTVFDSILERYFPGVSTMYYLPVSYLPPQNGEATKFYIEWGMRLIRCPGCETWQEQRAFRLGGYYHDWAPSLVQYDGIGYTFNWEAATLTGSFLEKPRCNQCFVREHGREELVRALYQWISTLIYNQMAEMREFGCFGWEKLLQVPLMYANQPLRVKIRRWINAELSNMQQLHRYALQGDQIPFIKAFTVRFAGFWTEVSNAQPSHIRKLCNDAFCKWLLSNQRSIARWEWLEAFWGRVAASPDMLARWALNRDGAQLI